MTSARVGRRAALAATVGLMLLAGSILAVTATGRASITLKTRTTPVGKVLTTPGGRTLYRLSPETTRHMLCTSASCLSFWKPLLVRSRNTTVHLPTGVSGTVGFKARGRRFQITLNRHPLYTFTGDSAAGQANGQRIRSFGGTWFVIKAAARRVTTPAPAPAPTYTPGY